MDEGNERQSFWEAVAPERGVSARARDIAKAIQGLSQSDQLRLKALACLRVRGLPGGVAWSDLLHETILRALSGSRSWPADVPLLAFLAGVMRSVCSEHWRRLRRERQFLYAAPAGAEDVDPLESEPSPEPDPEQALAAAEALSAVYRLFADDAAILTIMSGLAEGLTAAEIRRRHDLSKTDYDSARKRLRRALLRHGLVDPGGSRR